MGLVLDAGMEEDLRIRHLQVADATRASLGLPVLDYIITDTPLKVQKTSNFHTNTTQAYIVILTFRTCR